MKQMKIIVAALSILLLLCACSSGETLVEKDYQEFMDTIQSEDFTGFAYILRTYEAQDNHYLDDLKEVFDEKGETLTYFNVQTASEETKDLHNEESSQIALYQPNDEVVYIQDGEPMEALEITDEIMAEGYHDTLKEFIDNNPR
ncbi:hypothetical protein M662_16685 [Bacillus sp. SB49]|uniref:hypothetical protein n=1 Tax=Bacillus sp. SB49 TaxID=1071080 RepID=UPI0003FC82FB|nr:hypothetical protein [Bacillus sp. SB49]QHT48045.1 hypothetical protein M662_16685 [Bacillus sp. SB49]